MEFHCGSLGIRKLRHEFDSESYEAMMAYSEKDQVSQDKHGDRDSSTSLPLVALKEPRKPHDEPNKILSSSTPRNSRRSSSSTQKRRTSSTARSLHRRNSSTPWSSRRMNISTPGSSQRRTSSAQSSPSSAPDEVSRSRSSRHMSGPVVEKSDARRVRPGSVYWVVFMWFILVLNIHWSLNEKKNLQYRWSRITSNQEVHEILLWLSIFSVWGCT